MVKSQGNWDIPHFGVSDNSVETIKDFQFYAEVTVCVSELQVSERNLLIIPLHLRVIFHDEPG